MAAVPSPILSLRGVVTASILCIDDDPAAGAILEHVLTRVGHRTVLVSSAEEAVRLVARLPIDLILAEHRSVVLAGANLPARLKDEGHHIPVILMTEDSRLDHAVKPVEPGAVEFEQFAIGQAHGWRGRDGERSQESTWVMDR